MKFRRSNARLGALLSSLLALQAALGQNLKPDETFLFFPTLGSQEDNGWLVEVRGWIYEPETSQVVAPLVRLGLELKEDGLSAAEKSLLSQRLAPFLADSERGKTVQVEFGGEKFRLGRSQANGQVSGQFKLPWSKAPDFGSGGRARGGALPVRALLDDKGRREVNGAVLLVPRSGVSVVSDIDDTIKISQVLDRDALIQNTFLRPFRPVPGMAALYQRWQTNEAAVFHYVSASPWQLLTPLSQFLRGEGFPAGSVHLQTVRIKDGSAVNLLGDHDGHKLQEIEGLMRRFSGRRFVLVGDSGERDPEIYGEVARRRPEQVWRVLIRDVKEEGAEAPRYGEAFRGVERERWRLFRDGTELEGAALGAAVE